MSNALAFYQERQKYYQELSAKYAEKNKHISILRLLWFVLWFVSVWYVTRYDMLAIGLTAGMGLLGFIALILLHNRILAKKEAYEIYEYLNSKEIAVLNHQFSDIEDGSEFVDEKHFYSHDLDVFGPFSLFQYLNRCFTDLGKRNLAHRLRKGFVTKQEIEKQQEAVRELAEMPEWMQKFQMLGHRVKKAQKEKAVPFEELSLWASRKSMFGKLFFKIAVIVIPIASWIVLFLLINGTLSSTVFLMYLIIPLGFSGRYAKRINQGHVELGKQSAVLQKWQSVFAFVENQRFQSVAIIELQEQLKNNQQPASVAINQLSKLSQAFDTRLNLFGWMILNYFFSWDILQSIRLENWKVHYGHHLKDWFSTTASLEAMIALATLKFNRDKMIFPNIAEGEFVYQAKEAAHVLLPEKGRVANDIELSGTGSFTIVTGANMAGKSTYLRTVGSNMILALCGAAVCAEEMIITPIQLYTSIRTKDSLAKNESYFYAELLRLQTMIEQLKAGLPLFIILDEILKGTNSKDKEMGSKALVAQLIELKAVGLIATHDLQLGLLIESFPEHIHNRCFEVDIYDDQLFFDYKLRQGVSQNLNATFLMKKMGVIEA